MLREGLYAYWPMSETADGTTPQTRADVHYFGLDLRDRPSAAASEAGLVYSQTMKLVRANSEGVRVSDAPQVSIGNNSFAFVVFSKLASKAAVDMTIFAKGILAGDMDYELAYKTATDRYRFTIWGSATAGNALSVDAATFGSPATGAWHCLLCGYDKQTTKVFIAVNGGAIDVSAGTQTLGAFDSAEELHFGVTGGDVTTFYDGDIGPAMFWKFRTLATAEWTDAYNGGAGRRYDEIMARLRTNVLRPRAFAPGLAR